MAPFWNDLDCMEHSDVTVRKNLFSLYKRSGHSYRASFNGTNWAQTNGTGLDRFGRHGVESDVTAQNCFCYFYKGKIYLTFISTAQIEHKRMTPVLCDLDELGWRVTSQLPKIFWLYLRKENRYSVCFNGTNQHKPSTNELHWFGAIWATCGGEWRSKKECLISQTANQHKRSFLRHKSAQTNGIGLVIISFMGCQLHGGLSYYLFHFCFSFL